jgi:hypothetical protein
MCSHGFANALANARLDLEIEEKENAQLKRGRDDEFSSIIPGTVLRE